MAYRVKNPRDHLNETRELTGFLGAERARLFDDASPERREKLRAAERTREVYRAWNKVCQNTREGSHATGLHYLPESNELLVYMDSAAWAQEMTMLREIIRARMSALGVDVAGLIFKTSRDGYASAASARAPRAASKPSKPAENRVARTSLTPEQDAELEREVAGIEDDALRHALKKAIKASLECRQSQEDVDTP